MSYDEKLVERIRAAVEGRPAIGEKKMFGGICFLHAGAMFCGVAGDDLMVRVGPDAYEQALTAPHARLMDFTGRPMKGYVFVGPAGTRTAAQVRAWVERALAFVTTLPAKKPSKARVKARPRVRARTPRAR
jgi:TfoX/Sxy family transcriptional regulator of competence genes